MPIIPKGHKGFFASLPEETSIALAATARRLGITQASLVNEALAKHLLSLSNPAALAAADLDYENEIARLSASANALITLSNRFDAQAKS